MFASITNKQIAILRSLAGKSPVVASWQHQDLCDLNRMRLVDRQTAYQANGKISSNVIWTITDKGRRFLEEERAGQ